MMRRLNLRPSVIGLDIGRVAIKAVQVAAHDRGPRIEGAVSLPRAGGDPALQPGEAERLRRTLERRGMTASRLVLVAPSGALVGCAMSLPPAKTEVSREQVVQMELTRTQKLVPNGYEYAWWELPPASGGSRTAQAHALALPHSAVMPTIETLAELGLDTLRTVPASLALLAAAQRRPIDPRSIAAVLDLGSRCAHLSLMHAGKVVHERALPDFDLAGIRRGLSESLRIDEPVARDALGYYGLRDEPEGTLACETTAVLDEAAAPLCEEIALSFAYVSHMYPAAELGPLLLAGGGANLPGLAPRLGSTLELQTATLTPDGTLQNAGFGNEAADPSLTAATGAALLGEVGA